MLSHHLRLSRLGRTIPLAVMCSMVTVTVFYVLVNVAYYTMMSPAELLLSDAVAVVSALLDQRQILRNKVLCFNAAPLLSADVCKPCAPGTGIFDSHSCGPVLSWSAEWWLLWVAQVILDTAVSLLSFMQRLLRVTAYSLLVNLSVCVAGCCLLEPGKATGLQSFPWFTSADKHLCLLCCYWLSTFGIKVSTASPHITV